MRCPHCNFENPPGFGFCGQCGKPLALTCSKCGAVIPVGFAFCGQCGAPVAGPKPARLAPEDLNRLRNYLPVSLIDLLRDDLDAPPA